MTNNNHYFVEVLGTEYDELSRRPGSVKQTWGSYIVTEPSAREAADNCVQQYASMRVLDNYRPIIAHVRDEASMEVTETFAYTPQDGQEWIADSKGHKWMVPHV